jgi:hypothetical protein
LPLYYPLFQGIVNMALEKRLQTAEAPVNVRFLQDKED